MKKSDLMPEDIMVFANERRATFDEKIMWVISEYYNDNLECITNEDYDVVKIYRPHYELIYDKANTEEEKTAVQLKKEILDLYDKGR